MLPQPAGRGFILTQMKGKLLILDCLFSKCVYYVLLIINLEHRYAYFSEVNLSHGLQRHTSDYESNSCVLAVDLSCVTVKLGQKNVVCGCIEVHSMFYCSVNDLKVAGLIGGAAHHYG